MSKGSRWAIGSAAAVGAAAVWSAVIITLTRGIVGVPIAGFCLIGTFATIIALACFLPHSHPITLRIIGGLVFVALTGFAVQDIANANAGRDVNWRGLLLAVVFAIPTLYVAVFGRYPIWGRYASVFRGRENDDHSEKK